MEIAEALKRLKKLLEELEHLRTTPYDNNKLERCKNKADVIVENTFGKDSGEYEYLHPPGPRVISFKMYPTEEEKQEEEQRYYLRELGQYEIGIQKILDKYEMLGVEEKPAVKTEPTKVTEDYEQRQDKQPFMEAWDIGEAEADVQTLLPLINTVANEQNIPNFALEAQPANAKATNTFAWLDVFIINRDTASKMPSGVLTLQSLGANRTILRVPPRSQWLKGDLTPLELMKMGLIEKDDDAIKFYDACFIQFLKSLDTTLKKYRIKVTFSKRFLRGFKEVLEIYKAVKP